MNYFIKKSNKFLNVLVMVLIFSLVLPVNAFALNNDINNEFSAEQQIALNYLSDPSVEKNMLKSLMQFGRMLNLAWKNTTAQLY